MTLNLTYCACVVFGSFTSIVLFQIAYISTTLIAMSVKFDIRFPYIIDNGMVTDAHALREYGVSAHAFKIDFEYMY